MNETVALNLCKESAPVFRTQPKTKREGFKAQLLNLDGDRIGGSGFLATDLGPQLAVIGSL
jgi:hypothetical protein